MIRACRSGAPAAIRFDNSWATPRYSGKLHARFERSRKASVLYFKQRPLRVASSFAPATLLPHHRARCLGVRPSCHSVKHSTLGKKEG